MTIEHDLWKARTGAFIDTTEAKKPKVKLRKDLQRLVDRAKGCDTALLVDLVEGRAFLVAGFVVKRTKDGWCIHGLDKGAAEHTVSLDLSMCSCPDCKFRERDCKHIRALKGAVSELDK